MKETGEKAEITDNFALLVHHHTKISKYLVDVQNVGLQNTQDHTDYRLHCSAVCVFKPSPEYIHSTQLLRMWHVTISSLIYRVKPIPVSVSADTYFSIGADTSSSFTCLSSQHCCMHAVVSSL